jgi:hypothetical protein
MPGPTIHVNGTTAIRTGTGGSGALELLGHSLDGVDLDFEDMREFVYSDAGGGPNMLPIDVQEFGEVCTVSADLIVYDEAVFTKIRKRPGAAAEGQLSAPGRLMGVNGDLYRLLIESPIEVLPWNFPTTFLQRKPIKLSTKRSIWRLRWFAFAYIGNASAAAGAVLYNRVTT